MSVPCSDIRSFTSHNYYLPFSWWLGWFTAIFPVPLGLEERGWNMTKTINCALIQWIPVGRTIRANVNLLLGGKISVVNLMLINYFRLRESNFGLSYEGEVWQKSTFWELFDNVLSSPRLNVTCLGARFDFHNILLPLRNLCWFFKINKESRLLFGL